MEFKNFFGEQPKKEKGPEISEEENKKEKGPEIKIIGGTEEEREKVEKKTGESFLKPLRVLCLKDKEALKLKFLLATERGEIKKTKEQIAIIKFVNQLTQELLKKFDRKSYEIPLDRCHIVSEKFFVRRLGQRSETAGTVGFSPQNRFLGIFLNAEHFKDDLIRFGGTFLHEKLHTESFFSLSIYKKGKKLTEEWRRRGFVINSKKKEEEFFITIDNAIIEETTKRLFPKLFQLPVLKKEKEWLESKEAEEIKKEITKDLNLPEEKKDEIFWVRKPYSEEDKKKIIKEEEYAFWLYSSYRKVLKFFCSEIQKEFSQEYKNPDEVFEEFQKAVFTGKLLPIVRLIEKTFGKGSFRELGKIGTGIVTTIVGREVYLEKFQKMREKIKN